MTFNKHSHQPDLLSNTVRRINALRKSRATPLQDALDNRNTRPVQVDLSRLEATLNSSQKVSNSVTTKPRTLEVGSRTHADDMAEADDVRRCGARQSFHDSFGLGARWSVRHT
jgi:hypothetical protein